MALNNYGEAFARNVLRKYYANALTPVITNANYEGEIKAIGDRVNVLMFLDDIFLGDYSVGTDMGTQHPSDTETQLTISQKKYYNFDLDVVDKMFTYVDDIDSALIDNASKSLEKEIDTFTLGKMAQYVKAGNWIGTNLLVIGDGADTMCSIATTATGGSITVDFGTVTGDSSGENLNIDGNAIDSTLYYLGFSANDVGKPVRLVSQSGYSTDWYRITAVTTSILATVENWDGEVTTEYTGNVRRGDILKGLHGAGKANRDADVNDFNVSGNGIGIEFQAGMPTTVTSSTVYDQIVSLKEVLDDNDVPGTDRFLIVPPSMQSLLLRASELQPAIGMYYDEVVRNGRVGRVAGFEVLLATGSKISTRVGHSKASGATGNVTKVPGTSSNQIIACHKSYCTFAHKWAESRVVDSQLQFAKLYQGLNLYGAQILNARRSAGAVLFCTY